MAEQVTPSPAMLFPGRVDPEEDTSGRESSAASNSDRRHDDVFSSNSTSTAHSKGHIPSSSSNGKPTEQNVVPVVAPWDKKFLLTLGEEFWL